MKRPVRHSVDLNLRFVPPRGSYRPGPLTGIAAFLIFLGGILVWFFLFSLDGWVSRKIFQVELVVNGILLVANVFAICRIGYDGFVRNTSVTMVFNLIFAMIGFYLARVHILPVPAAGMEWMFKAAEFFLFFVLATLMSMVPTLVICLVMWLIMAVFGG